MKLKYKSLIRIKNVAKSSSRRLFIFSSYSLILLFYKIYQISARCAMILQDNTVCFLFYYCCCLLLCKMLSMFQNVTAWLILFYNHYNIKHKRKKNSRIHFFYKNIEFIKTPSLQLFFCLLELIYRIFLKLQQHLYLSLIHI